jgi:repressor LexA
MITLTDRQNEILALIRRRLAESGAPPTRAEIATELGFRSPNAAEEHLKALARKGVIELVPGAARGIRLPEEGLPVVGRVAAGQPILAVEQASDAVRIDRVLIGAHREVFGLRIVGESMIEDGILDGDYVFVKKTPSARSGEIVVAMIEGEATVKRYYPEGDRIRFQPANSNMEPIIVRMAEFKSVDIIGVVVGVYRKL